MKKYLVAVLATFLFTIISDHQTSAQFSPKEKLYTLFNIWKHANPRHMYCINYKSGYDFIPAGTAVYKVQVVDHIRPNRIRFTILDTGEQIELRFKRRWHPGISVGDYPQMMFSPEPITKLMKDFTPEEVDAIKQGILVEGMSKRAVMMSYGIPPEHRTPSLQSKEWVYWMNTRKQKKICFDRKVRAVSCRKKRDIL